MPDSERGADSLEPVGDVMARIRERLSRNPPRMHGGEPGPSPAQLMGRLSRAGIDERLLEADAAQIARKQRQMLRDWLSRKEWHLERGHGLYLWGSVGTGKTMAAVAVVKALAVDTESVRWWGTSELMTALENPYERRDLLRKVSTVRVLALDDFGSQVLKAQYADWLDQIADARHRRRRSTIVTSNVQPGLIGMDRLADRWRSVMAEVEFTGRSRREHEE